MPTRRQLLAQVGATTIAFTGLRCASRPTPGYGPLVPDPNGMLDLPPGFSYVVISRAGELMNDGLRVPAAHDGMAAFGGPGGRTVLVRNHELTPGNAATGAFGERNELRKNLDSSRLYDAGLSEGPCLGGTTTIVYDPKARRVEKHFLSLAGTVRNCAGGPTPWGTWVSCEETVVTQGPLCRKNHGFNFEVPARVLRGPVEPTPLVAMGRFNHEAIAVDPKSGIVYQTEDRGDSLLYRYLPTQAKKLAAGGRLQALVLRDRRGADTRNWETRAVRPGERLAATWIDLANVESPNDDLRQQGHAAGAALFARGEGMWHGGDSIWFTCTSGGREKKGQLWRYRPDPSPDPSAPLARSGGSLELFLEPNHADVFDMIDNCTIAPWGDLYLCEDGPEVDYVRGVTPTGGVFTFAKNAKGHGEFAGATFAPDGSTMFVNLQGLGVTCAISGPWRKSTNR